MKRMRNLKGFTLVELIVVILIIGILAAIAVIGYTNITDKAQDSADKANAKQVVSGLTVDATLTGATSVNEFLVGIPTANEITSGVATEDFATTQAYLDAKFPDLGATFADETVTLGSGTTIDVSGLAAQVSN